MYAESRLLVCLDKTNNLANNFAALSVKPAALSMEDVQKELEVSFAIKSTYDHRFDSPTPSILGRLWLAIG